MDSVIDCVFYSIKENINNRYDKLYFKVLKTALNVLGFNTFSLKINAFKTMFENIVKMYTTARTQNCKMACKGAMIRVFESLTMRLRLQNQLFSTSSNPSHFFYTTSTNQIIHNEAEAVLKQMVDRTVVEVEEIEKSGDEKVGVFSLKKELIFNSKIKIENLSSSNSESSSQEKQAGVFGFCHVCRKSANYYCKEQRVPICSLECKLKYSETLERLQKSISQNKQNEREEMMIHGTYLELFAMLSEKCFDKKYEKDRNCYLDVLLNVIKNKNLYLQTDKNFTSFLKTEIFPNILKIAINSDDQILRTCLIIFLNFVLHFRRFLMREIGVFIQDIFMEILESPNSRFIVKFYILQVLTTLIEKESIPFELFLNFDCREDSSNILERTIDLLVKIAQGKYVKSIYAGMINASDEEQLQQEAIQAIIRLIKASWMFLEKSNVSKETIDAPANLSAILDKKKQIDEAIHRFNVGKRNSLQVLRELKIVKDDSPESLAEFLRTDKRVSQTIIGELFGNDDDFNLKVLSEFLRNTNFKGMNILEALKHFLSLFELPKEGQKVERILESFSKQYAEDNSDLTEDAAYLLSFLLMMCHTSLHNPQVQEKMTLQKYLSIGKEVKNNGEPVGVEVLTKFYNELVANPLAVHSLEKRKQEIANTISRSQKEKHELFKLESQRMFETLSSKIKEGELHTDYKFVKDPSCLKIFISTIWTNLLAFFSTVTANCEKINLLKMLVDSCVLMIRICDHFTMQTERDSFINLLVQFSGLEKTFNKLFDEKNLLFMQAVLLIASKMGNHLHRGWTFVLNCLISLSFFHFQASKIKGNIVQGQILSIDEQNSIFISGYFSQESLSNVFIESSKLDEHSILDFINGMCILALKEIDKTDTRFCYILEQIVYVSYENIYRNPIEWLRIWELYDKTFEDILSRSDVVKPEIIEFAIDTLHKLIICCFRVN
jgi:brefeldin A-inhibited guanine nucleotide-exchange protein